MRFTKRFPTGRYASPDGPVDIPATRVKHWSEQFGRMKAAGLKIPVSWGHVSTALPNTPDDEQFWQSKFNAGYVDSVTQGADGGLEMVVDVPDEADAKRVGKSIRDASPLILPEFKDGAGNQWADIIGHFALCPQGVISGQSEFEPVTQPTQPALAMALSISGKSLKAVRLAMPFEKTKDTENQDEIDGVKAETDEAAVDPDTTGIELKDMGADAGDETKTQLLQLLDSAGLPIGDYVDGDDLIGKLIVALNVKKSHNEHDSANQQQEAAPEKPLVVADGAPVGMSLAAGKAAKPATKSPIKPATNQTFSLGANAMPTDHAESLKENPIALSLFNQLQTVEKTTLAGRLERCFTSGRCNPAIQAVLKPALDGFRLSLGADGTPQKTTLHAQIELLEALPAGAAWEPGEKAARLGLAEVTPPAEVSGVDPNDPNQPRNAEGRFMNKDEVQATIDKYAGRRIVKAPG